ncbi:MAG: hypothetical protein LBT52_05205 [Clostridiales Family XIII bacterium]|jgi:hypothetical protein|nr:hypothetical protein [Clostridiales Family XIII bacterium]
MDYELFYSDYIKLTEHLQSLQANQKKLLKRIDKSMSLGDLKNAGKDIQALSASAEEAASGIAEINRLYAGADMAAYLASGDFAAGLVAACNARGIDIVGEENSYEIFPYRLKINPQDEEALINGKKAPGLRPAAVTDVLEKGRAKLLSANFNAALFAAELAAAYDLSIIAGAKGKKVVPDADVYLNSIYKYMTPMRRSRKDYDAQSFAFDIARLYGTEDVALADGRKIQFGPSRVNNRAIRILDAFGNELFIATVRFYKD